jgi:exopolysaccharide biosynthesis polyprenyl glycosylphosphotransferase
MVLDGNDVVRPAGAWREGSTGVDHSADDLVRVAGYATSGSARWLPRYVVALVCLDAVAMLLGEVFGRLVRFGIVGGWHELGFLAVTASGWLLTLATSGAYEPRVLGVGSEEFRRVGDAAARFTAVVAVVVFLFRLDVARGLVVMALPMSSALTLGLRFVARKILHLLRDRYGVASHRVLVVGDGPPRDTLVRRLNAGAYHGLRVVALCEPFRADRTGADAVAHIRCLAESIGADTVAVTHSTRMSQDTLRRIAWTLEGSEVDLLVAPALTDIAGPRIHIRPVSGLPLLQIAKPEFRGPRLLLKAAIDLTGAAALLVFLIPVFVTTAVAVRLTSPGPVFFRQTRIGRGGRPFTMYKFRSMYPDSERLLPELRRRNDHGDGVLFKIRDDPRITPIGRVLRRYSVDELPQLLNVLLGQMSLVGPRPPLPGEVARYARDVRRRLLVKPGITGLWQVSGRSDLDWEETVRLDLYYVENWSAALDAEILWKTFFAVVRGSGAR